MKTLVGNPVYAEHVVYRLKKIFSDASKSKRMDWGLVEYGAGY